MAEHRSPKPAVGGSSPFAPAVTPKHDSKMSKEKTSPQQFIQEVRQEVSKVTWPTRKETLITTGMVLVMIFLCAIFFLLVDQFFAFVIQLILV